MTSIKFTLNTSTDLMPNLIAFYLISKTILYPNFLREKALFSLIIPILLITCKLSMAPFALMSVYTAYWLMKEKRFKPLFFATVFNLLIISLWMIRNVYVSGYLVFPIYSIDLFSFDWKLPKNIVEQEMRYIHKIGMFFFQINTIDLGNKLRDPRWVNILNLVILIATTISIFATVPSLYKKRKTINPSIIVTFVVMIITIGMWFMKGPDNRFIIGILCATIAFGLCNSFKTKASLLKPGITILSIFFIAFMGWNGLRIKNNIKSINKSNIEDKRATSTIYFTPYPDMEYLHSIGRIDKNIYYGKYKINNNTTIYLSSGSLSFDQLPTTIGVFENSKFCKLNLLEARSNDLQDGFRMKNK